MYVCVYVYAYICIYIYIIAHSHWVWILCGPVWSQGLDLILVGPFQLSDTLYISIKM